MEQYSVHQDLILHHNLKSLRVFFLDFDFLLRNCEFSFFHLTHESDEWNSSLVTHCIKILKTLSPNHSLNVTHTIWCNTSTMPKKVRKEKIESDFVFLWLNKHSDYCLFNIAWKSFSKIPLWEISIVAQRVCESPYESEWKVGNKRRNTAFHHYFN